MKNIISIYLAICLSLALTGFGQVSKDDVSNYLIEKQIINSNEIFPDNQLTDLKKKILDKKVIYYDFVYQTWPLVKKIRVGVLDDKVYSFPDDFNLLINDLDKQDLTKEQCVLTLMDIMLNKNDTIESYNEIEREITNIN